MPYVHPEVEAAIEALRRHGCPLDYVEQVMEWFEMPTKPGPTAKQHPWHPGHQAWLKNGHRSPPLLPGAQEGER